MSDKSDENAKNFIDFINKLINEHPKNSEGVPHVIGIQFNGGDGDSYNDKKDSITFPKINPDIRQNLTFEIEEDNEGYVIQTELPGDCPNRFHLDYSNKVLTLITGSERQYVMETNLDEIDPKLTKTHLKNSVLEITCYKVHPDNK